MLVIKSSQCPFTFSLRTPKFDDAPQSVKVYEDSIVRFSKRVNFDIGCQMNFKMYPVDMQKCEVKFESFGYQTNVITHSVEKYVSLIYYKHVQEVLLEWGADGVFNEDINLPGYQHHVHMVL